MVADCLSRAEVSDSQTISAISMDTLPQLLDVELSPDSVAQYQHRGPDLQLLFQYLDNGQLPENDLLARQFLLSKEFYTIVNGILYNTAPTAITKGHQESPLRLVVPRDLRALVLHSCHMTIQSAVVI